MRHRFILTLLALGFLTIPALYFGADNSSSSHPPSTPIISLDNSTTSPDAERVAEASPQDTFLVTRVIDGDTIEIESGVRVRYIGIDTPESVDPRKVVQCFGLEASERNKELVLGKRVHFEKDVSDTDKYGRLLRFVYTGDTFINLKLVEEGFAHAFPYPPDVKYADLFRNAERLAREAKLGLWDSCGTTTSSVTSNATGVSAPTTGCTIKGNISSSGKIYHLPECPYYAKTVISESAGERWFCSEQEALNAGWRKALNCP